MKETIAFLNKEFNFLFSNVTSQLLRILTNPVVIGILIAAWTYVVLK